MIGYNELYEVLRKEKYSEVLQPLPKSFLADFRDYIKENKDSFSQKTDLFSDSTGKSKKQFENSLSIFRELILKRKKKILNLVFVATETGIMKRDYENMLDLEREMFDKLVKIFEDGDRELSRVLADRAEIKDKNKMILFKQNTERLIDHEGNPIGPFKTGDLANVDLGIADILVTGGKAVFVDEN